MDRMSKQNSMQTNKMRTYLAKLGIDASVAKELVTMRKTRQQISEALVKYFTESKRGDVQQP